MKPSGAHARSYDLLYDACPTCDETGPPLRLDIDEEADPPRYAVSVAWGETAAFDAVDTGTELVLTGEIVARSADGPITLNTFRLAHTQNGSFTGKFVAEGGFPPSKVLVIIEGDVRVDQSNPRVALTADVVTTGDGVPRRYRLPWSALRLHTSEPVAFDVGGRNTSVQTPNAAMRWAGASLMTIYPTEADWLSEGQSSFNATCTDRMQLSSSTSLKPEMVTFFPQTEISFGGCIVPGLFFGNAQFTGGFVPTACPTSTRMEGCLIVKTAANANEANGFADMLQGSAAVRVRYRAFATTQANTAGFEFALVEPGSAPVSQTLPMKLASLAKREVGLEQYGYATEWMEWSTPMPKSKRVGMELRSRQADPAVILVERIVTE